MKSKHKNYILKKLNLLKEYSDLGYSLLDIHFSNEEFNIQESVRIWNKDDNYFISLYFTDKKLKNLSYKIINIQELDDCYLDEQMNIGTTASLDKMVMWGDPNVVSSSYAYKLIFKFKKVSQRTIIYPVSSKDEGLQSEKIIKESIKNISYLKDLKKLRFDEVIEFLPDKYKKYWDEFIKYNPS